MVKIPKPKLLFFDVRRSRDHAGRSDVPQSQQRPYSKDTLGDDFRVVRTIVFGSSEKRQLQDFRRSGSIEALIGEVYLEALGRRLGNSIQESKALQRTYLPLNLEASRRVDDARLRGRRVQRHEQAETKKSEKSGLRVWK
jgi:hypothetical protein